LLAKREKGAIMHIDRFPYPVQTLGFSGDCAGKSRIQNIKMGAYVNMKADKKKIKIVCLCAATAALYAVLTMITAPVAFGAIQFRVSEALCVLPFFVPQTAWGLFAGCIISNIMSGNVFDIIFGSLATLLAAGCTALMGKRGKNALLACLMPVLFNGIIVGAVITYAYEGGGLLDSLRLFAVNALWVSLGEAAVMFILGYPLIKFIENRKFFSDIMPDTEKK
jgi:uncharacterized membrane protein